MPSSKFSSLFSPMFSQILSLRLAVNLSSRSISSPLLILVLVDLSGSLFLTCLVGAFPLLVSGKTIPGNAVRAFKERARS